MLTPEWTPLLTVIQMISAVASWHPEAADVNRQDALCLARNIYFEARGEGLRSQFAVAAVTLILFRKYEIISVLSFSPTFLPIESRWSSSRPWHNTTMDSRSDAEAWRGSANRAGELR